MADSRNRQLAQLGTGLDVNESTGAVVSINICLLYTSDAADE